MQLDLRYLQVRIHQRRVLHQLHVGRQGLLRDDPGLLQVSPNLLRERLLLLHLLQQHASLLRHLRVIVDETKINAPERFSGKAAKIAGAFLVRIGQTGNASFRACGFGTLRSSARLTLKLLDQLLGLF
jgi:hypothetical protein